MTPLDCLHCVMAGLLGLLTLLFAIRRTGRPDWVLPVGITVQPVGLTALSLVASRGHWC